MYEDILDLSNIKNLDNYPNISNFLSIKSLPLEVLDNIEKYCYPITIIFSGEIQEDFFISDIINLCENIIMKTNNFDNNSFIKIISKCKYIKKIHIIDGNENKIDKYCLQTISSLKYLNELKIYGLDEEIWAMKPIINKCKYIEVITFYNFLCNIEKGFLTYIGNKIGKNLKKLDFFDMEHSKNDILYLMQKCYNLEEFTYNDFVTGGKFDDECIIELGKNNRLLKKLYLNTYSCITDNGLKLFVNNLENPSLLTYLHLGQGDDVQKEEHMINITDYGLIYIAKKLKNLQYLNLSFRDYGEIYTSKPLFELAKNCGTQLKSVTLNYFRNKDINQQNINTFLQKCPNLVEIEIKYSWYAMGSETLPYMYNLQKLVTGPIPIDFYNTVKERCKNLKEFYYDRIDFKYNKIIEN